jgi:hypothetical protein
MVVNYARHAAFLSKLKHHPCCRAELALPLPNALPPTEPPVADRLQHFTR